MISDALSNFRFGIRKRRIHILVNFCEHLKLDVLHDKVLILAVCDHTGVGFVATCALQRLCDVMGNTVPTFPKGKTNFIT